MEEFDAHSSGILEQPLMFEPGDTNTQNPLHPHQNANFPFSGTDWAYGVRMTPFFSLLLTH